MKVIQHQTNNLSIKIQHNVVETMENYTEQINTAFDKKPNTAGQ